jgi:hypothetical protein
MSAPKIIYITPAPEGGFVEFWAEHPSAARGDVAYIPQKGATKMQAEIDALKTELAALKALPKVLSADEVKEVGYYWHKSGNEWEVVEYYPCGGFEFPDFGQFIGPIQMPEVCDAG